MLLEKGKQSENLDYLDGLPEDFQEYLFATKIKNETNKSDRLSSRSNNSDDEPKNSIYKKLDKNIIKTIDKYIIEQNDSEEIVMKMDLAEEAAIIDENDLNKPKNELKNYKKIIKKIYSDTSYGVEDFQREELNEEYLEGLYDYSNKNVELNPKYEEAQFYEDYFNEEDNAFGYDLNNNEDQDYYDEIPRENFFINKAINYNHRRDLI